MKILVTGSTGFLGYYCCRALMKQGFEVHGTTSLPVNHAEKDFHLHQVNLLDDSLALALVKNIRPTHLLHLAWYTQPGKFWNARENLDWVKASLNLIAAFREAGGQRFVGIGSCAEYQFSNLPCIEELTPPVPTSFYGLAKNSVRELLSHYSRETGLSSAWARIFYPFGPRENPEKIASFVTHKLLAGAQANCSAGTQIRDYIFVTDVADAISMLLLSEYQGVVNIGTGKPIAIRELVLEVAKQLGRTDLVLFGQDIAEGEAPFISANTEILEKQIGFTPKTTLQDGLARTIEWCRKRENILN